jgi:hypothetical protein
MAHDKKKSREKVVGQCALCLETRTLQRSHLIGKAIYALNRDDDNDPVMMTPERTIITSRQMWQHLLCRDCEQLISKRGEDYVSRLIQRRPDFPLLEKLNVALYYAKEPNLVAYSGSAIGIDTDKLAYFAISMVWRSGVCAWRTLGKQTTGVSLGELKEPFRKYLVGETDFPSNIAVTVTVSEDLPSRFNTFAPSTQVKSPTKTFSFLMRGLWFHIVTNPDRVFVENFCCVNSARKTILRRNCEKDLIESGAWMLSKTKVPKKLAGVRLI